MIKGNGIGKELTKTHTHTPERKFVTVINQQVEATDQWNGQTVAAALE
jgi:hypothetical protein